MAQKCYGCFREVREDDKVCPYCGYHIYGHSDALHILQPGTVLNQKYTIGKTLGEGGFGITYLAWDNNMRIKIAIKEFYPIDLVTRDISSENQTQVYTVTQSRSSEFHQGLERFVGEASTLAQFFNLPGIVSVKDFFYENRTAYIVMEYIEGITLKEYLNQRGGVLSVEESLALLKPVIESLAVIHKRKLLHRDISPDNLMITEDYRVKLIDFGSARYFDSQSDKSMTVVLKHGYAPLEQYSSKGLQGAWTDVYSLCATLYRMLTGRVPDEAINRIRSDALPPIRSGVKKIPGNVSQAIDKGLSVMAENRQQTMEELYYELYMNCKDFRSLKRNKIYQNINRFLARFIVAISVCLAVFGLIWIKRDTISLAVSHMAENFVLHENGDNVEETWDGAVQEEDGPEKLDRNPEETDQNEKPGQDSEKETAETGEEEQRNTTSDGGNDEDEMSVIADADAYPGNQEQDAGMLRHQTMRAQTEPASDTDDAIVKVKDGKLNNVASEYTVGEILDLYSDTKGRWYTYKDEAVSGQYVYYEGSKGEDSFVLEFEVYEGNMFKLSGAMQNDAAVERYADFFQSILDYLGF